MITHISTIVYSNVNGVGNFLETVAVGALEIAMPGLGAAVDKGRGFSKNPNAEMVFKSVPFRQFALSLIHI